MSSGAFAGGENRVLGVLAWCSLKLIGHVSVATERELRAMLELARDIDHRATLVQP